MLLTVTTPQPNGRWSATVTIAINIVPRVRQNFTKQGNISCYICAGHNWSRYCYSRLYLLSAWLEPPQYTCDRDRRYFVSTNHAQTQNYLISPAQLLVLSREPQLTQSVTLTSANYVTVTIKERSLLLSLHLSRWATLLHRVHLYPASKP